MKTTLIVAKPIIVITLPAAAAVAAAAASSFGRRPYSCFHKLPPAESILGKTISGMVVPCWTDGCLVLVLSQVSLWRPRGRVQSFGWCFILARTAVTWSSHTSDRATWQNNLSGFWMAKLAAGVCPVLSLVCLFNAMIVVPQCTNGFQSVQ